MVLILIVGLISSVGVIISAVVLAAPTMPSVSISQTLNSRPLISDFAKDSVANAMSQGGRIKRDALYTMEKKRREAYTVAVGKDYGAYSYVWVVGRLPFVCPV